MIAKSDGAKKCLKLGSWGAVVTAICCFTPVLVVALGIMGLGMFIPYLDYLLLPALGFFLILAIFGLWQKNVHTK
jgi:mercuric ion transport protein